MWKGIWAFVSSILYIADIVFDALQCKTYHDFAYEEAPEEITVNEWYFIVSMITWAGPPVLLMMFWFISYFMDPNYGTSAYKKEDANEKDYRTFSYTRPDWDKRDLEIEADDTEEIIKRKTDVKNRGFFDKVFALLSELFWSMISALFLVYIMLPIFIFLDAARELFFCNGEFSSKSSEEVEEEKKKMKSDSMEFSFLQLFEHIGEAIPQFTLAAIFYYYNYEYVAQGDFSFEISGFLITQTLISMVLSAVSILKGIIEGIKSCCKLKAWKTSNNPGADF